MGDIVSDKARKYLTPCRSYNFYVVGKYQVVFLYDLIKLSYPRKVRERYEKT